METKKETKNSWLRTIVIVIAFILVFPLWLKMGKEKIYDKEGIEIYASEEINPADVARVADSTLVLLKSHGILLQEPSEG